jgi:hypothetical protein
MSLKTEVCDNEPTENKQRVLDVLPFMVMNGLIFRKSDLGAA